MVSKPVIIRTCGAVALCAVLAAFYATAYPSHLLWQEQNQIFLNTPHWIASYFGKPAWLGCLAGDWLTQFYRYPVAGAVILTGSIAYCTLCFAIALRRLTKGIMLYALTALFALLTVACSMPASSSLAFFICVAGGLTLALVRIRIPLEKGHSLNLSPLLIIAAFWAFGFGFLLTGTLMLLYTLKSDGRMRWLTALCIIVITAATPALLCGYYNLPYKKALLYPGIPSPALPDYEYEERLAIADSFYGGNYNRAKKLALSAEEPNDFTAFYYYLASAMQDSLPDNLLKYPLKNLGTLTTINDTTPLPVINMMNDLYYELGDMTYAERAAMMRNVFSPRNRNVRMMQRLAEINLVSGDTLAALKYLRILGNTNVYAGWSKRHTPGQTSPEVEKEILRRRKFANKKDNIRLGDNCRNILLELLESNPHNTAALDYLLCTDLLLKDMDTFKMDYDTYCMENGRPRYKKLYQEALMIYLAGSGASDEEWERYIVPDGLADSFRRYSSQRGNPAFSDTYWYYFDKL